MTHFQFRYGAVLLATMAGCSHKSSPSGGAAPTAEGPGNAAVMAAARRNAPVLDRAITANDLNSLKQFMDNQRATTGKYPANLNELKQAFGNEGQKLFKLIEDGDLVMTWNTRDQGVLAYDKRTPDQGGMVLSTTGIERMTPDELKQALRGN